MKLLNLIMAVCFAAVAISFAVAAVLMSRWTLTALAFVPCVLACVAYGDYKKCLRDEEL
jgi:hypothetical protein